MGAPEAAPDPKLLQDHLGRLDRRYAERFSAEEIAAHVREISLISPLRPVRLIAARGPGDRLTLTVVAFDFPSVFSMVVGVLSSMGFNTESGDVFTRAPAPDSPRRIIIDRFSGAAPGEVGSADWERECAERLERIVLLLEAGGSDSVFRTKAMVNEMAARAIREIGPPQAAVLFPVSIEVDASPVSCTRMRVVSQDTPFFLFAFSTALSLQGVSIEHVSIRTVSGRIEDDFEFTDISGKKIEDRDRLDRIKLSVLLTKQFTSALEGSPDPLAALVRFESLVPDILRLPEKGKWFELLSNPRVLGDLANLLGASTYLWEDFIRLQYESLIPMLQPHVEGRSFCGPVESIPRRLGEAVRAAQTTEEFAEALNAFKDREIFLYDLDHILIPGSDFLTLSRRLSALASAAVDAAAARAYADLSRRYGEPRTVAGLPVRYAVMGLGKMGGEALGYASDIELLFVYGDSGSTSGPETAENAEFFGLLVRGVQSLIHAKREGIFHVDLRLRPYGASGPLAVGLAGFCTYFAKDGPAHALERLALVRLRRIGGDPGLGARVERIRDDLVYSAGGIDPAELREAREKQLREKTRARAEESPGGGTVLNAKFSPGALVDLEYAVQLLQITHGAAEERLRTPRIHEALDALASIGILEDAEAREIVSAYRFFRRLINGLRMLRGSARDLFLPSLDSDEYMHLARRTGYVPEDGMSPARRLHLDFETHTAEVRAFVERRLGRENLAGAAALNAADLVLSRTAAPDQARAVLAPKGFRDPARALVNLRNLSGEAERKPLFARLAVLATDILSRMPDPDMALNNWERFIHSLPDPGAHLDAMLSQPMRLEILLGIFSASQFMADTLVKYPDAFDYIGRSGVLRSRAGREEMARGLMEASGRAEDKAQWRDALRRFRRREILRIGARDVCLGVHTRTVMEELSDLAEATVNAGLRRAEKDLAAAGSGFRFCVLAFGKLGGRELNYSSDIDLLGIYGSSGAGDEAEYASRLMEELREDLSAHTPEGYAYRVDLRLRPYGTSGQLVSAVEPLLEYYGSKAALWELQALIKARPVAGDIALGGGFLEAVRRFLTVPREREAVVSSIDGLRREAVRRLARSGGGTTDVKTGLGGIRDVEFLVQGLQLVNAAAHPGILDGNTLAALEALGRAGIMDGGLAEELSGHYLFLRRVEHFLQVYEDRQTHSLPRDPEQLRALARRMMGSGAEADAFLGELSRRFGRVREAYGRFFGTET